MLEYRIKCHPRTVKNKMLIKLEGALLHVALDDISCWDSDS